MEIVDRRVPLPQIGTTIVSVPVDPAARFKSSARDRRQPLPEAVFSGGLREAIESMARTGIAEGVLLGDLTNAFAMAYREAMDTRGGMGERRSG